VELANLAGDTLHDVIAAAERGIHRIRHTHHLAFSFLRHSTAACPCGERWGHRNGANLRLGLVSRAPTDALVRIG
jgi:hypothetical protein